MRYRFSALRAGFSFTFKIPFTNTLPVTLGISSTAGFDTNGKGTLVLTPEVGVGSTPGPSGFVRVVIGPDANTSVEDIKGPGTSVSGNTIGGSVSVTFPGVPGKPGEPGNVGFEAPIFEIGVGRGKGISVTQGFGYTAEEVGNNLLQGFDYGKQLVNATSAWYSEPTPQQKNFK